LKVMYFFSSRRRHTRSKRDWSSDVCSSDLEKASVEKVEIAGPGFINFFMKSDFLEDIIPNILTAQQSYGETDVGKGKRAQVEFVSVNPTGSVHLVHARGAAFGDVLSSVLAEVG